MRWGLVLGLLLALSGCGNIGDEYEKNRAASQLPPTPPPTTDVLEAKIFSPSWARVGLEMELDASGSTGGAPGELAYAWTLAAAPVGSNAQLQDAQSVRALFVPDVEGVYEFSLAVERDGESDGASSQTTVVPPASFVSTVQTGVVAWTDVRANLVETITLDQAVDVSRSLFMMTVRTERTNPRYARYSPRYEFLDDRTIEITMGAPPNDPLFVAWTVLEFTPEAVVGVERGTVDRTVGDAGRLEIPLDRPVDPSRAFVVPILHQTGINFAYEIPHAFTATLTADGSAVALRSNGNPDPGKTLSQWQVVEFTADVGVTVSLYELDIAPGQEFQRFPIEVVSPRDTFLVSAGADIVYTNTQFPVRQAYRARLADGETIEVRKNNIGTTKSEYTIALYAISVAGARVEPFEGAFQIGEAVPATLPSWPAFDRDRFDPVVMSGWTAFQFIWGSSETTKHADLLYTVELNPLADSVHIERGEANSASYREFSGYVVGWPRQ